MAKMEETTESTRPQDRRREPRLPLDVEVLVRSPEGAASGRTRDASTVGLLVELEQPLPSLSPRLQVEFVGGHEAVHVETEVVRRLVADTGGVMLALRIVGPVLGAGLRRGAGTAVPWEAGRRRRPSRAKPRPPRAAGEARHELQALGARMLELAMMAPDARAPVAMVRWVDELRRELGVGDEQDTTTNRLLLRAIADLHRAARA